MSIVKAQEELRESQRQATLLADLVELSSQPFGTGYLDGRIDIYNSAFPRLLGYSKEEFSALNWSKDLTPPEWQEKEAAILEELHRTGRPVRYEKEYRRKDGTRVPVEILVHLRRDKQGEPSFYYAFVTDITARKQAEAALRESETRFRTLFESMREGVALHELVYDDHGRAMDYRIVSTNPSFEKHTGLKSEQVQGQLASIAYGAGAAPYLEEFARVAQTGRAYAFETFFPPMQRHFQISVTSPKPGQFVTVFEDITPRKRVEEELRESREDLNRAQAVAHAGSWRLDVQRNTLTWSDETYRMFGIPLGAALTYEMFLAAVHPDDRGYVDQEWTAALTGEPYDIEHRILVGDEVKWVSEKAELEFDPEGRLLGGFGSVQDITERKQAEEKLQRTLVDLERSNQELKEFAYVTSHDLQEPLRKIGNFSEMVATQYQGRLDDQADKYLSYITDGAKRMKDLINDLLALSRVGRADFTLISTDINDILMGMFNDIQPLVQEKQAEITHEAFPTLKVNPLQMRNLLQNLIVNALKFHGNQPPRIHISARQEGREWVMAVRDNGIGFQPQYAEGIFNVFRRLHTKEEYPGTGIGLAICKKIVERHGGRIWAESELGRGATFYFTIPA